MNIIRFDWVFAMLNNQMICHDGRYGSMFGGKLSIFPVLGEHLPAELLSHELLWCIGSVTSRREELTAFFVGTNWNMVSKRVKSRQDGKHATIWYHHIWSILIPLYHISIHFYTCLYISVVQTPFTVKLGMVTLPNLQWQETQAWRLFILGIVKRT